MNFGLPRDPWNVAAVFDLDGRSRAYRRRGYVDADLHGDRLRDVGRLELQKKKINYKGLVHICGGISCTPTEMKNF